MTLVFSGTSFIDGDRARNPAVFLGHSVNFLQIVPGEAFLNFSSNSPDGLRSSQKIVDPPPTKVFRE